MCRYRIHDRRIDRSFLRSTPSALQERTVCFFFFADKLYISDKLSDACTRKSIGQTFHFGWLSFIMREKPSCYYVQRPSVLPKYRKNWITRTFILLPAYSTWYVEWPQKSSGISDPEIFYGHRLLKANGKLDIYRQKLIVRNDDFATVNKFNIWWYMVAKCFKKSCSFFFITGAIQANAQEGKKVNYNNGKISLRMRLIARQERHLMDSIVHKGRKCFAKEKSLYWKVTNWH